MSCISEETVSNEDHLDSLEERITEKCEEWSKSEYKVLSGRELSWYHQAKEERKRQKISEDHAEALEEKEKREAIWKKERSKIHGEARKKHIHKKALEEWEQEKWSRNVVNELDKTTDEPCEVAVVTDQEYLDQLIEEYVTGELSLGQFEYKLEDIIGLRDVTSERSKVQTGSTSFIETVF
jgi:phosphatidate phosphatase APP1